MVSFVRSLLQYYGTVRLPVSVRPGRVLAVHRAGLAALGKVRHRVSRVPHTMFPCMPGVFDPARCVYALPKRRARCGLPRVRSASAPRLAISGLYTLPARSPVNASRTPLPKPVHDSGPAWLAKPSLSETCTLSHRAGLSRRTRTLAVSRARKRKRSGRWRASAPLPAFGAGCPKRHRLSIFLGAASCSLEGS
jgi:hypothetical protein